MRYGRAVAQQCAHSGHVERGEGASTQSQGFAMDLRELQAEYRRKIVEDAFSKAKLRIKWAKDAREKAQLRLKWARESKCYFVRFRRNSQRAKNWS